MGARAQEAVTFNSQQTDINLLRLLGILAAGAEDATGLIDPAPSRTTLAGLMHCTERTITNRISRLIESGELEQVRVGSGPGNPSAYKLILEIPEITCFAVSSGPTLEQRVSNLEREMGEIKAQIFTLSQTVDELVELIKGEKGGKGESERVKRVKAKGESPPEVECRRSPLILSSPIGDDDPGGEESPPAPLPPPDVTDLALWQSTVGLVGRWANRRGIYRHLNPTPGPKEPDDYANYFAPALRLVQEYGGDAGAAFDAAWLAYQTMLRDGLTPRRLAPVVEQVLADLDRQAIPAAARASPRVDANTAAASYAEVFDDGFSNLQQG